MFTLCSGVAVWKAFILSMFQENPLFAVIRALDNFLVQFFQLVCNLKSKCSVNSDSMPLFYSRGCIKTESILCQIISVKLVLLKPWAWSNHYNAYHATLLANIRLSIHVYHSTLILCLIISVKLVLLKPWSNRYNTCMKFGD